MGRFIVIVLDGFGVGQMPDVEKCRPQDIGSNTAESILKTRPDIYLPTLETLGLMNILGHSTDRMNPSATATYGKAMLRHIGADTFWGHQEIAGSSPPQELVHTKIRQKIPAITRVLTENNYDVSVYKGNGDRQLLIVNNAVTVADNVECDPGAAFNVTAALDYISFEEVHNIGTLVRSVCDVPRVIAFGGRGVTIDDILSAVEEHPDGYIGVNAPKSGVYREDYHCIHLGYGVNPDTQIPTILGKEGVPVFLLGKAADILHNEYGKSFSIVDTSEVLTKLIEIEATNEHAFIIANVQETDLAGHRENSLLYAKTLEIADELIGEIKKKLNKDDIMFVMADHGNDPLIGHSHHTREYVPLMVSAGDCVHGDIGVASTLSDVAATAADYFNVSKPENGRSLMRVIREGA